MAILVIFAAIHILCGALAGVIEFSYCSVKYPRMAKRDRLTLCLLSAAFGYFGLVSVVVTIATETAFRR